MGRRSNRGLQKRDDRRRLARSNLGNARLRKTSTRPCLRKLSLVFPVHLHRNSRGAYVSFCDHPRNSGIPVNYEVCERLSCVFYSQLHIGTENDSNGDGIGVFDIEEDGSELSSRVLKYRFCSERRTRLFPIQVRQDDKKRFLAFCHSASLPAIALRKHYCGDGHCEKFKRLYLENQSSQEVLG